MAKRKKKTQASRFEPKPVDANPWLVIRGAAQNNLRNIDVEIPLGRFVCVTGVSGSGKSSLVNDILREALARDLNGAETARPGKYDSIEGLHNLDKVIDIDQSPIGRTPRSNPATYIKLFDEIRALFAKLPDSKVRGYAPARFSFNVATGEKGGGRCEACEGNGQNRIQMDFLADVWTTCPVCEGRRFNHETLQVHYRGKSIHDVLDMDVQEALEHFDAIPKVRNMLDTLHAVGLDYLKLGQASTTLSGGEAQRIKLAKELVKRSTGRTLYLLDEPTTGLHFEDIRRLLAVLHGFVDAKNSVVVIEHNMDVIKTADWIIDMGPEGGSGGGEVVATGTPEEIAANMKSHTGESLRELFGAMGGGKARNGKAASGRKQPTGRSASSGGLQSPNHQIAGSPIDNDLLVVGAREHNLKDLTVRVPRGRLTVCSGVSGSGKSSFAMDTVYVEGQRRYVESLSSYARQFLGQFQKPKVDHVYGLSPAIAIEQKAASNSPRSTVGTVTEIYDYMRVLWARIGTPYCPKCDIAIGTQSSEEIIDKVLSLPNGSKVLLCAPVEPVQGEKWEAMLNRYAAQGYVRARIDGEVHSLDARPSIDARRKHVVELVVDRAVVRADRRGRLADSVEHCLTIGKGVLVLIALADDGKEVSIDRFSQHLACDKCQSSYENLTPHNFSFNARVGWCSACEGLGVQRGTSAEAILADPSKSILSGGVAGWDNAESNPLLLATLTALADAIGFDANLPLADLDADLRRKLLFGLGETWIQATVSASKGKKKSGGATFRFQWKGFFPAIDEATRNSWQYRQRLKDLVTDVACRQCKGARVNPQAAAVRFGDRPIGDVCDMPLADAAAFFRKVKLTQRDGRIAGELLHEIKSRLRFLVDVGLGYITLARSAPTLSGGESQRIRLASQIGSGLTGVLYVLDEPTIGLHPRDNRRLIDALHRLRDLGNTLLMVEHDAEVLASSDHIIDFGPQAGVHGGELVAEGRPTALKRDKKSLTGRYLAGKDAIVVPTNRRPVRELVAPNGTTMKVDFDTPDRPTIKVTGARQNNLRNIDVAFPLGRFTCITGVSGSGKSSLISEILYPALAARLHRANLTPGAHNEILGMENVDKVINVDQQPIGVTPSSNPATYTGIFDLVRQVYARLPESKVRGYTVDRFSFNRPGGRCDDCNGLGQVCHEMHFLPDVWVPCETCDGKRYQREILEVRYKGKNIAEILEMPVAEALEHFQNVPKVKRLLQMLDDVGLGYISIGQSAPTLSGGEAQRVKLAAELGRPNTGRTMFILDEPTTGLHFDDVRKLLDVLHRLVDLGNTVVCIEHNLDVMKTADWVIDIGPEAGNEGGQVVVEGTPEIVGACKASHTGRLLGKVVAAGPHREREVYDPKQAAEDETEVASSPLLDAAEAEQHAVKMPWQRDGRKWHTGARTSRDHKEIRWEGDSLAFVVDQIEKLGGDRLQPTDWNDRARVEIVAKAPNGLAQSAVPWFLHALTGGEWILDLLIRTPANKIKQRPLQEALGLKTLNDRDDIHRYGDEQRVRVRRIQNGLDQTRVMVFDKKEINTATFRAFLKTAVAAYLAHVDSLADKGKSAEPWKEDGKAWHMSQKIMKPGKRKKWTSMDLTLLVGQIQRILPKAKILWDRKVFVEIVNDAGERICKIITHQATAMRIDVHLQRGALTDDQVRGLGYEQEFQRPGTNNAELSFFVRDAKSVDRNQLKQVLTAAYDHVAAALQG